jgi:DNA polymerase-3 subunit alpha
MSNFSHLHTNSHYSLLSALPKVPELVNAAKGAGMKSLALTDNGNLYGAIEFYKACIAAEIKPIIGVNFYVAPRTIDDKDFSKDKGSTRLILLAQDEVGYKNLIKLVTISNLQGFFITPRIDKNILETHKDKLVAIIPAIGGEVSDALLEGNFEKAKNIVSTYKKILGDNLYLEITNHPEIENHQLIMEQVSKLSKESEVSLVACQEVFYLKPEDRRGWQVVHSIQNSETMESHLATSSGDFYFINQEQAQDYFKNYEEALENNQKIADSCNLQLELGRWTFPKLVIKSGRTAEEELREITYAGIERRGLEKTDEIVKRIEYELEIIKLKGFAPYFLVVADLLKFAKAHGILSNIRGSVSGSLVTFLSGITNINPLEYQIPFERFLNPERPGAPDIDMDYADDRRDEMIEYARATYGKDHVAQIGTFGTMMARGAVRDVARALGYPYGVGDRISKLIPFGSQGFPMTITHALEITPELKELYDKEADVKEIIDMALKIEGNARHISIHAAGVVMSPVPLNEVTPVQLDPKESGKIITQYDMYSVEEAGLLKFDFLGLKNLSIIASTISLVKKMRNIDIDYDTIPIDDKKTFEMLARGETADTFQLNGTGMTRFLVDLKPSSIHDINAMVALYRPGPMQFIPDYIARKHNPSLIKYLDPALKPILEKTYGILVYQDDLLMMANQLAGYSWGEVDKFRKAVGKKIPAEMEAQREKFIKGVVEHSKWNEKKATELWTWIEPFASYGFNKAHSVSYGRVAYITAYLKANFTGEYMAAILTAEAGDVERVSESVAECKRINIPVLPPDINESFREFTLVRNENGDSIRFGLSSIKNFGEGIAQFIIDERTKNGPFKSLDDFLTRVKDRNLNRKSLEALIQSGTLDSLEDRGVMVKNFDDLIVFNKEQSSGNAGMSLFGSLSGSSNGLMLKAADPMPLDEKLKWEKELLGLYISGHPLDKYKAKLEGKAMTISRIQGMQEGMIAVASGLITEAKPLLTKNGERMCFLKISDYGGSLETVVFPRTFTANKDLLVLDNCVAIKGKVSKRNGGLSLIAEEVRAL